MAEVTGESMKGNPWVNSETEEEKNARIVAGYVKQCGPQPKSGTPEQDAWIKCLNANFDASGKLKPKSQSSSALPLLLVGGLAIAGFMMFAGRGRR
jgi:hypothetical protein